MLSDFAEPDLGSFVLILAVAVAAPLLARASRRIVVPTVVVEVALGIVIGPQVLDLAQVDEAIFFFSDIGLAFLFFLAGLEIELAEVRGRPAVLATGGWFASAAIAIGAALVLAAADVVDGPVVIGVALATTTLGVLTPVLRDNGLTGTRLGTNAMGAGVAGELFPILFVAIFLSAEYSAVHEFAVLVLFFVACVAAAIVALRARPPHVLRVIAETVDRSGQLAVRLSVFALILLVWIAVELNIDFILGAFAAGLVVGLVARGETGTIVRDRISAVGYGLFVPIFFVVSGMRFDLDALLDSTTALILLPVGVLILLAGRGLPALLLYRRDLDRPGRFSLAFFSATSLPLIVAITEIGVRNGDLSTDVAAALVGAGMISVLVFPSVALILRKGSVHGTPVAEAV